MTRPLSIIKILLYGIILTVPVYSFDVQHTRLGETLSIFRFVNTTNDSSYDNFHILLRRRLDYELLFPGLRIKAWDSPYTDTATLAGHSKYVLFGTFETDSVSRENHLTFTIINNKEGESSWKKLPAGSMSIDDIAETIILKTGNFLKKPILGELTVSSNPPGCDVLLDGVNTGRTPKVFSVESGEYRIRLDGEFLDPFEQSVLIEAGKTVDLNVQMNFKGYPTFYWLAASSALTGLAVIAFVLEKNYHDDYMNLDGGLNKSDYKRAYKSYARANYIGIGFRYLSIVGWTGTGFCFFINRSLKRRIFGRN
ncbi:MAG: PEGA domain-containing protein [Chitinivibrionales bacterium]|nr:PEGA domain-containing protein [Chitinivibrionales bacterium]